MAEFTMAEVCLATGGLSRQSEHSIKFNSVSTDTRRIKPGSLFVALSGEHFDGHDFIAEAVRKGASGVVISRNIQAAAEAAVIMVPDTRRALQELAFFHRRRFNIPVVAITGSNGKTTTKDMTAVVLASRIAVLKTEANYNNEIGLPLTLLNLTSEHQAAVVEMGMRGKGEIKDLANIAQPTIGVVTNVGESHIERLGSLAAIAEAKAELVEAIGETGLVILNSDNAYVSAMSAKTAARILYYGLGGEADIRAKDIISRDGGTRFICCAGQQEFPVQLTVPGRHNVYNALAAIAVGLEIGLTSGEITKGLLQFTSGTMRLHIEQRGDYTIINDAYNASPLSMAAAVDTLSEVASGRKIAILGDMLELGEFAEEAHCALGRKLAQHKVDAVVTVGTLARFIALGAQQTGVKLVMPCEDHAKAQAVIKEIIKPGDTLLIKGSRGMKMEKMLEMF